MNGPKPIAEKMPINSSPNEGWELIPPETFALWEEGLKQEFPNLHHIKTY
jgi:hypothetical protein